MRFLFVFLLAPLLALWIPDDAPARPQTLAGVVTDPERAPLADVTVEALKDEKIIAAASSDAQGAWQLTLAEGLYDLRFTKAGYGQLTLSDYAHKTINQPKIEVNLKPDTDVSTAERITFGAHRHRIRSEPETTAKPPHPTGGHIDTVIMFDPETYEEWVSITDYEADAAPAPPESEMPSLSIPKKSSAERSLPDMEMRTRGSRSERALSDAKFSDSADDSPSPALPSAPAPRAGLLTAGEWNDLHNWSRHWVDILADGEADQWQKLYGFYPRFRYAARLVNESGHPMVDAPVALRDADGTILWEARTDNTGRAELWYALYDPYLKEAPAPTLTHTRPDGEVRQLGQAKDFGKGYVNEYQIAAPCRTPSLPTWCG